MQKKADDLKKLMLLRFFEKDNFLLFIYKKAERIASALYLVSTLMSDNEPMRRQLRETAVAPISRILSLMNSALSKPETVSAAAVDFLKLSSLLDMSKTAGLISEMNFTVLKKEIENLLETISFRYFSKNDREVKKFFLDKEFFAVPINQLDPSIVPEQTADASRGKQSLYTLSDVHHLRGGLKGQNIKGQNISRESAANSISSPHKSQTQYTKNTKIDKRQSSAREDVILKLLRERNNLTIRDFSSVIKDCSEKTIQRELLRMVSSGVLKKEGERRWSHYSLNL